MFNESIFQKSDFLTAIAKGHDGNIDEVCFFDLPEKYEGLAVRDRRTKRCEIYIDKQKHECSYKVIFTLFHEIGHIVLGHFDIPHGEDNTERKFIEIEADNWALRQLGISGILGQRGHYCDECIRFARNKCA